MSTTQNRLPRPQKSTLRHQSPELRLSQGISTMQIERHVDWYLIQVKQLVRTGRKIKKGTQQHKQMHLPLTKNRLTERLAGAMPIPSNCRDCHQIPRRLMSHTGKAMGENRTKIQKVKNHQKQQHSPPHKKSLCRTSRGICSHPKLSLQSSFNLKSIDV